MKEENQSFHFLIIEHHQDQQVVHLEKCVYSIGRSTKNSVVLSSKGVSRQHAHLYRSRNPQNNRYQFRIVDGNLQGKRSMNGLTINNRPCFSKDLEHGDVIRLCQDTYIRYYKIQNFYGLILLNAFQVRPDRQTLTTTRVLANSGRINTNVQNLPQVEFSHTSSFLELMPTPIIEISLSGSISYCNLAARQKFPKLLSQKLRHPILKNLYSIFKNSQDKSFFRKVEIGDRSFEQFVCLIQEMDTIRSYVFSVDEHNQQKPELPKRKFKEQALLEAIPDLILNLNSQGEILEIKPSRDPDLIFPSEPYVGQNIAEALPATIAHKLFAGIRQTLVSQKTYAFDCELVSKTDQLLYCEVRLVWNSAGDLLAIIRNITKRKTFEQQLRHEALHDHLTGLLNRQSFLERVDHVIKLSKRRKSYLFAVLFIDLDRFKVVNDSLGHLVGDRLLVAIAHRLTTCLRAGDTVARLGGDEFTVLLEDLISIQEANEIAERIISAMSVPAHIDKHEIFVTASVGIASSKPEYDQPEQLLRDADTAMYQAKARGRNCYEQFSQHMHEQMVGLLQLDNDLRRAIERQEFQLYYQPIVALKNGSVAGFEALIRWQHPQRG